MDKEALRQQEIDVKRDQAVLTYPYIWNRLITDWNQPGVQDCAWLIYSANYLFRSGNIRWALDPLTLNARLPVTAQVPVAQDLGNLDFVLITHKHADHLDLDLIRKLIHLPIQWVIPKAILPFVLDNTGLSNDKVIVPHANKRMVIKGISILPFDSIHWEWNAWESNRSVSNAVKGLPETGYRIDFNGKKWLFPGDIRTYDPSLMPHLGVIDGTFAHLWLGRRKANVTNPKLVNRFCSFFRYLKPKRIVVTHLFEYGRVGRSLWNERHFELVRRSFNQISPDIQVEMAVMGDKIILA